MHHCPSVLQKAVLQKAVTQKAVTRHQANRLGSSASSRPTSVEDRDATSQIGSLDDFPHNHTGAAMLLLAGLGLVTLFI